MQRIAKAIAAFITSLILTMLSYVGVSGDMTVETALTALIYGLIISIGSSISVYLVPNKPK